ncbi:MAG: chemotaxis protein CheD [Thermodesulfobacteriota bacterium]
MANELFIGVADMRVSNDPSAILITYALGCCIGVSIYDPVARVGGLLHFMLPKAGVSKTRTAKAKKNPYMFADTGVPLLFQEAYKYGADKGRMVIKIAGGAQIKDSTGLNIGKQNYMALREIFQENDVLIHKEDVGGNVPRTMGLDLDTGRVYIKVLGGKAREL